MAKKRLDKSLADYVAIAVSPVLIMLLVGTLVWFLLEATYSGEHASRLRWILFWFVIAIVLVARIGIEQGKQQASLYGLALAGATSLVVLLYAGSYALGAIGLLALVWWCATKLTWDCTLIDDTQDASGEGLLQIAGLEPAAPFPSEPAANGPPPIRRSFWQRMIATDNERSGAPHAPGLWVVYFSLAALPIFGIGQSFIASSRPESRDFAFRLLAVYVAAALALLVTTSFLGLRRYLRQRQLSMPAAMTGLWLGIGGGLIVGVLVLCLLLPRPDADYSVTALLDRAAQQTRSASKLSPKFDDAGQGEGRRVGQHKPGEPEPASQDQQASGDQQANAEQQGNAAASQQPSKDGQTAQGKRGEQTAQGRGEQQDSGQPTKQRPAEARQEQQQTNRERQEDSSQQASSDQDARPSDTAQNSETTSRESPPRTSPRPSAGGLLAWLLTLVRWAIYGLLALGNLYVTIRFWPQIMAALRDFWNALMNLFGSGAQRSTPSKTEADAPPPIMRKSFTDFANPFARGAVRASDEELVTYTFQALEAWGAEHECERLPTDTPLEFGRQVAYAYPEMAEEVQQLAHDYAALAYAGKSPSPACREPLARLWRQMTHSAQSVRQHVPS